MKKIIFVCHGNICRSAAAEYIMKKLTNKYIVSSKAVSNEEMGNDIYPPMKRELDINHIPYDRHYASKITYEDYMSSDYIFYMDESNHYYLDRMFPHSDKIYPIYQFTKDINEIEDPWYTRRFDKVFKQIYQCVEDIIDNIEE